MFSKFKIFLSMPNEEVKMALQGDSGGKDDLKTQFLTREGVYKLLTHPDYLRPSRLSYPSQTNNSSSPSVRLSFVSLPDNTANSDNIAFNYGRELYVYVFNGSKKRYTNSELPKPVDKKIYKGTNPTCHDFNQITVTAEGASLLVGFSTGQILLIDPFKKDLNKLFNEDRSIDKSKVTCIKWVPGSTNLFLASHSSGQLYLYNEELPCGVVPPQYQLFKQGEGFSVSTCKTKSTRNPLYRWVIGPDNCCINEIAFSPCGSYLAVVSQDGFLRVFDYDTMELAGMARSYFGGFLCVCWSPDGRYVVVGGEDDLVTVWSFSERCVVARGQGHRSWVSVVAFDPFACSCDEPMDTSPCYRLGSVGQDTQLCLWDITEDILRTPVCVKARASNGSIKCSSSSSVAQRLGGRRSTRPPPPTEDPLRIIGTGSCPRFDECPLLEPLICKKIAHERLTDLIFREDCFVTACQDGYVYTWSRPSKTCVESILATSPTNVTVGSAVERPPGSTIV